MAVQIDGGNIGGILEMNEDGSLTFTREDHSKADVMSVEQAIGKWPHLEQSILAALKRLPG
jgi:hypothetical protein